MGEVKNIIEGIQMISKDLDKLLFPALLGKYIDKDSLNQITNSDFINSFQKANKHNLFSNTSEQSIKSYILSNKTRINSNISLKSKKKKIILAKLLLTNKKVFRNKYSTIIESTRTLMGHSP